MAPFAHLVEERGFDSLWVTDHVIIPLDLPHVYKRQMLDALGLLNYLAGVTRTIPLGTSVLVLPYRHPVHVAKQVATADQLSGGRVIFGAAAGYMEGEFEALNADFANRGAVADESLEVIKACWAGTEPSVKTDRFALDGLAYSPLPAQRPGPPIWIGGVSKPAMRRAVRHDGWHGMPGAPGGVPAALAYLREESEKAGRESLPTISMRATLWYDQEPNPALLPGPTGTSAQVAETLQDWADAGVEHTILGFPEIPLAQAREQVERLAAEVRPLLS